MEKIPVFTINRKARALSKYTVGIKGPNFELEYLDSENPVDRFDNYLRVVSGIKYQFENAIRQHALKKIKLTFSRQRSNFYQLFEPFDYWVLWSNSEYCSFNELEIKVINTFRKVQDITVCAATLQLSADKVSAILRKCVRKLKNNTTFQDYRWWLSNQLQQSNRKDLFLNAPLSTLNNKIPMKILSVLFQLGDTLKHILNNTTEKELISVKGMGDKGIQELKEILDKFDCLDQLRSA